MLYIIVLGFAMIGKQGVMHWYGSRTLALYIVKQEILLVNKDYLP